MLLIFILRGIFSRLPQNISRPRQHGAWMTSYSPLGSASQSRVLLFPFPYLALLCFWSSCFLCMFLVTERFVVIIISRFIRLFSHYFDQSLWDETVALYTTASARHFPGVDTSFYSCNCMFSQALYGCVFYDGKTVGFHIFMHE